MKSLEYTECKHSFKTLLKYSLLILYYISKQHISMKDVVSHIDDVYDSLVLGFSPVSGDREMFEVSVYDDRSDDRLFYRGKDLKSIEEEKLFFPQLSHA